WAAFAGGCLAGVGLGGLTRGVSNDVNYFVQEAYNLQHPLNGVDIANHAPTMWGACLVLGAGLGTALAAMIREERQPGLNRSEQPDESCGAGQDTPDDWTRPARPAQRP